MFIHYQTYSLLGKENYLVDGKQLLSGEKPKVLPTSAHVINIEARISNIPS